MCLGYNSLLSKVGKSNSEVNLDATLDPLSRK